MPSPGVRVLRLPLQCVLDVLRAHKRVQHVLADDPLRRDAEQLAAEPRVHLHLRARQLRLEQDHALREGRL